MARVRIENDDEEEGIDTQAAEMARLNMEEGGEIFRVTDELRATQGVALMIVRILPAGEGAGYCGMMSPAEFSHEALRDTYGPGTYKIRIQGPKGFLPGGGTVKIAPVPGSSKHGGGNSDVFQLLELLERREAERKKESGDKFSRVLELSIPVIGTILSAMISRPQGTDIAALVTALKPNPGPSLTDLTSALSNMKSLTQEQSPSDPIDTALKILEHVNGLKGGDGSAKETNWLDVLRDVVKEVGPAAKPIVEGLQRAAAMRAQQAQQATVIPMPVTGIMPAPLPIAAPVPIGEAPAPATVNGVSGENQMLTMFRPMIKAHLTKLATWAGEKRDPAVYVDVFVDELPRNLGNFLPQEDAVKYLQHPEWFEFICKEEPSLAPHREWCDEFRKELIELLTMPPDDNTPESASSESEKFAA